MERLSNQKPQKILSLPACSTKMELLQQKVANLETLLRTEWGLSSELHRDTEAIQKQLELVTCDYQRLKWLSGRDYSVVGKRKRIRRNTI